jgi:transcription-repair coupling factor (superfamily II helicase)
MKKTKLPADHQIFERYHKYKTAIRKTEYHFKELTTLSVGDYVTHIDHGIGRFGGLQKNTGREQNTGSYKLVYADNDIVYVSIHSLHKISKYTGKMDTA